MTPVDALQLVELLRKLASRLEAFNALGELRAEVATAIAELTRPPTAGEVAELERVCGSIRHRRQCGGSSLEN